MMKVIPVSNEDSFKYSKYIAKEQRLVCRIFRSGIKGSDLKRAKPPHTGYYTAKTFKLSGAGTARSNSTFRLN